MDKQKYNNYPLAISQILGLIEANDIAIPEIQRPFVWRKSQVRDLMDSLYKGYPTGYIIIWKNPSVKLKNGSLLWVNENGESAVFFGAFRPFVGVAHGRPVIGAVGAVSVASVGCGEHPVIEVVDTLLCAVEVAVGSGLVEIAIVLLLLQEIIAA